ncbi:ATP-dependent Clp protease ATP-binding subunit [Candidatus Roizmanbacteria bacterium]|nr:ATP-dependent Clp protease ATP-binding subunit [Candidatus Roizmanbacteria bacterium]
MRKLFSHFIEFLLNIFLFLPYFFSVPTLLKTLFRPWKNLISKKTEVGFSFAEWFNRFTFNLISRLMGFMFRCTILFFFLIVESLYILFLPLIFLGFLLLLPFLYPRYLFAASSDEKKAAAQERFVSQHLLVSENRKEVEQWFEHFFESHLKKTPWWKLENLFSIPPLARDWAVGYTPRLDQYSEELTKTSYQSHIQNAVNREKEIRQIETILSQNEEANVLLVGEEGVGKHTIIDAFAKRIYEGSVNPLLIYKRVLKLNLEKILSTYLDQKQRETFLEQLLFEAQEAENIILFIENLDRYIVSAHDRVDLSLSLEKYAKTSTLHVVATTTPLLYQRFILPNDTITQLFSKVDVSEVAKEDAKQILLETALSLEEKNKVTIPYETVNAAVEKSDYYISYIPFPEKAISLLDIACISTLQNKNAPKHDGRSVVVPDVIGAIISEKTHVPTQIDDKVRNKLLNLETTLSSWILHQQQAVEELASTLRSSFVLLGKRKKPLASFLFLGPTGVGKTETAKALTMIFFGSEKNLIRFDMSSHQLKEDIPNLIGSVEKQNPGLLPKAIREIPYGVLLLDEIEKANSDLLNLFLTVLDEGYFTDGFGKRVDCKHLIIIATSNAASDVIFKQTAKQSSVPSPPNTQEIINYLIDKKIFSPEFLNRFDGIIAYQALTKEALLELGRKILNKNSENLYKLHGVRVEISDQTLARLVDEAYRPEFGARNLERTIHKEIEDKVATLILQQKIKKGETVRL